MKFTKVLVAEDTDSNNFGIVAKLKNLGIDTVEHAQYCDNAHLKIKKALLVGEPYQLLVSDLSFDNSNRKSKLSSGEELIEAAKTTQPNLKVIVFSVIDKQTIIKNLLDNLKVNAYVCKGLNGLNELEKAIEKVYQNQQFTCPVATSVLKQQNVLALNKYEQQLLQLLATGYKQNEISEHFKLHKIAPNSVRSIEAHISKLKDTFDAKTTHQLVYMVTSLGLL
ncbi:response regulator [uncultured Croceitalea sp.]|uniref:response regulator n=1 Tax=uncultured Croceitalea sp. TaxID=1798908 RepID=UPI003306729C